MLCPFWPFFDVFDSFLIFEFCSTFFRILYLPRYSEDEMDRSAHPGSAEVVIKTDNFVE